MLLEITVIYALHSSPFQAGSNAMLKRMNRVYTREYYLERVATIRRIIPDCGLSTDIIAGFCGETEEDHLQTLDLMKTVEFDSAFMFKYSVREGTLAAKKFIDDVPEETKLRRLNEIINLQQQLSLKSNQRDIGKEFEVWLKGFLNGLKEEYFVAPHRIKLLSFQKRC